jgi:hypothetical protein
MDLYEYQPLPDKSIRLLEILQESTPESIKCRLQVHDSAACPEYVALSYTWEPCHPQQQILVDGKNVIIGHNLACYLKTVVVKCQKDQKASLQWIDQICIDQHSNQEKSHQVSLMYQIYSNAAIVHIWLGESADDSDYAIQVMHSKRASLFIKLDHKYDDFKQGFLERHPYWCRLALSKRERQALIAFSNRQYWQRLWIVQEVVVSQKARVLCGYAHINWVILANFFHAFSNNDFLKHILWLSTIEAGYKLGFQSSLDTFLGLFRKQKCSIVQDRVYGLLAIAEPNSTGAQLQPDYSRTVHETYEDVIHYINEPSMDCVDRYKFVFRLVEAFDMKAEEATKESVTCSFLTCQDPQCKGINAWHRLFTDTDSNGSFFHVQRPNQSHGSIQSVRKKIFNFKR